MWDTFHGSLASHKCKSSGITSDTLCVASATKVAVEHYEMARYGTLMAWAEQLDMEEAAELLEETLDEEKETDEKLTELSGSINEEADDEEDEDEPKKKKAS